MFGGLKINKKISTYVGYTSQVSKKIFYKILNPIFFFFFFEKTKDMRVILLLMFNK